MKKQKSFINQFAFFIAAFAIVIFIVSFAFYDSNAIQESDNIKSFNTGWTVNGKAVDVDSTPIQYSTTEPTVFSNVVPEDMVGKTLEFYTSHQKLYVYFDNKLTYSLENGTFFNHTAGTAYNVVEVPCDAAGKEIRIEIYNSFEGVANNVCLDFEYGTMQDIFVYYLKKEWFDNVVNILLLVSGLIVLFSGLLLLKYVKSTIDIIYLSLFEVFMAIWALSISGLFNILVGHPSAMNTVSYFSLFLAPLFCLLYVRNSTYGRNLSKRFVTAVLLLHCLYIAVATILQVANIYEYNITLRFYHLILAFEVVIIAVFFFRNIKREKNSGRENKIDKYLLFLLVGVGMDLVSWNITYTYNTILTRLGILIYTTSIIIKFAKNVFIEVKENSSKNDLKEIAYTDQLTGLWNRNAFISRISHIDLEKVMVVAFDLNNLKYYNDRYGHDKGDLLLVSMAQTLREVFGENAYRIGGDEFEVIMEDCTRDELWTLLEKFESQEEKFNKGEHGIYLQAAYGVGYYQGGDSINDIIKIADENMYMHKKFLKSKGIGVLK